MGEIDDYYRPTVCEQPMRKQQSDKSLMIWGLAVICFGLTWNPNLSIRYDGNFNPIEVFVSCLVFYSGIGVPLGGSLCFFSIARAFRSRHERGLKYFGMVVLLNLITLVAVYMSIPLYWYYWHNWRN